MAKHHRFMYKVRPTNNRSESFPIDMLRYDVCWPRSTSDAIAISSSLYGPRTAGVPQANHDDGFRHIALIGLNPPTPERWQSFGWMISTAVTRSDIVG